MTQKEVEKSGRPFRFEEVVYRKKKIGYKRLEVHSERGRREVERDTAD